MESKSLCILGACRNTAKHLPAVLQNLETIEPWWKECKIVIFENDSIDNTPAMLSKWAAKGPHRQIITESKLDDKYPNRVTRLAYIRNRLLHYIPPSFDYFMVVDLDDVFTNPVKKESFESCFELDNWDVIAANGYTCYYDLWPLRVPGVIENDCWNEAKAFSLVHKCSEAEAIYECVEKYKEWMWKVTEPLVVYSAFNIGILGKVSAIHTCCRYASKVNGLLVCEHVPFQTCLRSHGARILFNPNFRL